MLRLHVPKASGLHGCRGRRYRNSQAILGVISSDRQAFDEWLGPLASVKSDKIMTKVWQQPLPEIFTQLSEPELRIRIQIAKEALGSRLAILGHHYQQDAIIDYADFTG